MQKNTTDLVYMYLGPITICFCSCSVAKTELQETLVFLMAKNLAQGNKNKPQNLSIMIRWRRTRYCLTHTQQIVNTGCEGVFPSLRFCVCAESALMTSPRADRFLNAFTAPFQLAVAVPLKCTECAALLGPRAKEHKHEGFAENAVAQEINAKDVIRGAKINT